MAATKVFKQLEKAMREDDFRAPYPTAEAAQRAALEGTPSDEREGLPLLRCEVPAGVYVQPLDDEPGIPGPLTWYDYGDPEEAAEEYGIERYFVVVVARYDAKGKRWDR